MTGLHGESTRSIGDASEEGETDDRLVILDFKTNPNTHSMCDQESSFHTYRTTNGYRITNVTIYSIYYANNDLQKTKSNTLEDTVAERHHNSICNRLVVIASLELLIKERQIFFSF
jgi:hypothetical protein